MKKALLSITFLIIIACNLKGNTQNTIIIPDSSIRLRIISNSNDSTDINTKLILKSKLEKKLYSLIAPAKNKNEADSIIKKNMDDLEKTIDTILQNDNYTINYGSNYFPSKIYKGVVYNKGFYDSLVITLGKGNGNNWWCVLFPPLCLLEENNTTDDVTYQLFISRILDNFK